MNELKSRRVSKCQWSVTLSCVVALCYKTAVCAITSHHENIAYKEIAITLLLTMTDYWPVRGAVLRPLMRQRASRAA